jgi:integrase
MPRLTDARVSALRPPAKGQDEYPDDLVQGLRIRVGAGGRKSWIVRARSGKQQINKTLGTYPLISLGVARDMAREFLLTLIKDGGVRREHTFGELADHWIEHVAKPKNKSWHNQMRRLEIYVLPKWRNTDLASIRRSHVRDLIDGIEGKVAPGRALAIIRTLFRYAMGRDWIEASPAEAIPNPSSDTPRDRYLDMKEVAAVYKVADLLGYPFTGFIKMMILTAQRRTEVASMKWADINLDAGTWVLSSEDNKSARAHLVPLSLQAVELLKTTPQFGPYVWSSDGESHVQGYSKAKQRIDGFLLAGGLELKPWRLHDLRRTVATHMVRLGISELVVGRVLNHAPQGVTARTYALHSYEAEKRDSLSAWADELDCTKPS